MSDEDRIICENAILGMRKENPKELKNNPNGDDFVFFTFQNIIALEGYKGTDEEALTWWNNQRNPNDN